MVNYSMLHLQPITLHWLWRVNVLIMPTITVKSHHLCMCSKLLHFRTTLKLHFPKHWLTKHLNISYIPCQSTYKGKHVYLWVPKLSTSWKFLVPTSLDNQGCHILLLHTVHVRSVDREFLAGKIFHLLNFHLVSFSLLWPLDEIKLIFLINQEILCLFNFRCWRW